jgi:hypothetical protein
MLRFCRLLLFVSACVLTASVARGQRLDGTLRVTVTDTTGGAVEDARVTVTHESTNVSKSAIPSSAGIYVVPDLLVGNYTVTVEKAGFKKSVAKGGIRRNDEGYS